MPNRFNEISSQRSRVLLFIALMIVICLGLASRKVEGLPTFIVDHFGDALWTMAVYLSLAILPPKWAALKLGLLAIGISFTVEASQLIQWAWLKTLKQTQPGKLLLGSGFLWIDLLRYFCGGVVITFTDLGWQTRTQQSSANQHNI